MWKSRRAMVRARVGAVGARKPRFCVGGGGRVKRWWVSVEGVVMGGEGKRRVVRGEGVGGGGGIVC